MRIAVIIGLVIVCAWLLSERHTLQGQIANIESKLDISRKQTAEIDARLKAVLNAAPEKQTWLQQHINKGARMLEAEPRPVFNGPYDRPQIPGSRIIR
jgi:hypothetical protein